jgi:hypothetical protein
MPALRLIVADHSHVIGENPAEARVHKPCRALLLGRRIRRRPDFEFQTHSLVSRCQNRRDFWRLSGPAGLIDPDFTTTSLAVGLPAGMTREDMLLWNAEVQYVCRNAARQSYGQQIRGLAATSGPCTWLARPAFNIATNEAT